MNDLAQFLDPVRSDIIAGDVAYNDKQIGRIADIYKEGFPEVADADIILVGTDESRGAGYITDNHPADMVREQLYRMYLWHADIKIADIGNIKSGSSLNDSYSCLKTVLKDFRSTGKSVVIIGGSHDNTLAQYMAYAEEKKFAEATVIDAHIDLQSDSSLRSETFLMEMLTSEPNYIRHYNHIGFQSYFVHPYMLETMDKLRFDVYRVGAAKEHLEEMEPIMRGSDFFSFDMGAVQYGAIPGSGVSPNGFSGEEACSLARFAGMAHGADSFGIYGYRPEHDINNITAIQISQMIWYFIDGKNKSRQESEFSDTFAFNEYHTSFADSDVVFLQSKKTGRWWMKMPGKKYVACSYSDYLFASNNEIPERWLRVQEREG
ncbi:MAG TPA: arginase family protein [Ginsengibacter sp.]|nr:arginase family protein [Ginsengibacter sp.]HRP17084.1 arginase family protein [Ginsengibacter sp.]HRP43589.1 arginase family protein [Ginsengibacter sp.]